jgi:hypothetical protein
MTKSFEEVYDSKVIDRFVEKLELGDKGCINWTGGLDQNGYGDISVGPREGRLKMGAHRWALGFAIGCVVLPSKVFACHSCDNPKCVNPMHLFPGNHAMNMADMVAKGRSSKQVVVRKLTDEQVLAIRNSELSLNKLRVQYGISKSTASYIKNNRTWKNLTVNKTES